jgi:hypothetical protein
VLTARQAETPGTFAAAATRALPRDLAAFTGRQAELALLIGGIDALAANGGVVGIHAIDGMAGIGKTTLAVHAAHQLAGRFPDGQLFLPLHGHTPGQRPVDPSDEKRSGERAQCRRYECRRWSRAGGDCGAYQAKLRSRVRADGQRGRAYDRAVSGNRGRHREGQASAGRARRERP